MKIDPIRLDDVREILRRFIADNQDIERVELLFPDMNGVFRGKWVPLEGLEKVANGGVRLPISSYGLDIWGRDVDETRLALETGDPDGVGVPVVESLRRTPWSEYPTAQVLMTLETAEGEPVMYDPRQQLVAMVKRFAELGLTPVIAAELEFYLFKSRSSPDAPPEPPNGFSGGTQLYDLDIMNELEEVLREIRFGCEELGIPADTVTAEIGPGQFEINFHHQPDALAAADHAMLFRRVVWGCAIKHDLESTFMAKPYGGEAGSGMHVHVSLLDADGTNVFSNEGVPGDILLNAIGGTLETMRDFQAIFAPNHNSYRRFQPGSYAPSTASWGIDNRGAAVRVPEFEGKAARLEHRISGSDVNPYLAIAAILGGILHGLENKIDPGPPIEDGAANPHRLYRNWSRAVEGFYRSAAAAKVFGKDYRRVYTACRRAEIEELANMVTDVEHKTYLSRI